MKIVSLLIVFFGSFYTSFGQLTINPSIEKEYKKVFKQMKSSYRMQVKEMEKKDLATGFAIFTTYDIDTLNLDEFSKDLNSISISIQRHEKSDHSTEILDTEQNTLIPALSMAQFDKDTMVLSVGIPFYPIISHSFYDTTVVSFYEEYFKGDTILRLDLSTQKTSALKIPVITTKFCISTNNYRSNNPMYGLVEFETLPYFVDSPDFKSGHIKKKLKGRYVFKVKVGNESNMDIKSKGSVRVQETF